jgi:hypothetical protein
LSVTLDPFLMSTDRSAVARLCAPGTSSPNALSTVVVDWERIGKVERQACSRDSIGTDTQISNDTTDDLCRIRSSTDAKTRIICRINPVGDSTAGEIELAIANGADEVLLPMVRSERDVQIALDLANGRIEVGAFIETESAVTKASRIGALPLARVYVGLMDLGIARRSRSIFEALSDGTVERVRDVVRCPFGFGGLTVPWAGRPIPSALLLGEMARLQCAFTLLRRSFLTDVAALDVHGCAAALDALRAAIVKSGQRSSSEVADDRRALLLHLSHNDDLAYR